MQIEELKKQLCFTFCTGVSVSPVPAGYAITSFFEDSSGDRLGFYLLEGPDGYQIEDDGSYLSHLIAKNIPITHGMRAQMLDAILSQGAAYWDRETYEIKTENFAKSELSHRVLKFVSAIIRVRDLELVSRDNVRSTFREDAMAAVITSFGEVANLNENEPIDEKFAEFPADFILRPKSGISGHPGAIYLISHNDKLTEGLLLKQESQLKNRKDFSVIALIEEPEMRLISRRKFQRAQNRGIMMPIFRGDEDAAMGMIARTLDLPMTEHISSS